MRTPPPGRGGFGEHLLHQHLIALQVVGQPPARAPGKSTTSCGLPETMPGTHPGGRRPVQDHGEEGVLRHLAQPQAAHFRGAAQPPGRDGARQNSNKSSQARLLAGLAVKRPKTDNALTLHL